METIDSFTTSPSIFSAFATVAARFGGSTAISTPDTEVTYASLYGAAVRIGDQLARAGIGKGHFVGLVARRSAAAIAAILGIARAGAAYVPLDISYPGELLKHICRDSGIGLVIVEKELLTEIDCSPFSSGRLCPISFAEGLVNLVGAPPNSSSVAAADTGPDDVAYVMYTSGSTGAPKGVMVPHRGILRLVLNCDYVALGPDEVILHLAPLSFDASTFEIWGALLNGGRLAVVSAAHPSLDEIAAALQRHRVTTAWLTAGLFNLIVENRLDALRSLRQLLAGGDVLSPQHVATALAALPTCRLINGYGPTENTTFTCCYTIPRDPPPSGPIPIGFAIAGTSVHVLDSEMRPVPAGEDGELYAGGDGVALGYLNQPELTSQKFIDDPFSGRPGARLYRTGDRVRQRADGLVEFLGRVDRQIKLNGKRIELDAIEAYLREEDAVQDAAVVAHVDPTGRRSLAAFVTPANVDADALRRSLRARLPDFMVPATIDALAALPLSPNGKIDRARLLAREAGTAIASDAVKPKVEAGSQDRIARIVAGIIGQDTIKVDDNFFDIGASSLDIIAIHAKLVEAFGPVLTTVDLFAHPNVKSVAAKIDGDSPVAAATISAAERARGRSAALRRAQTLNAGRTGTP